MHLVSLAAQLAWLVTSEHDVHAGSLDGMRLATRLIADGQGVQLCFAVDIEHIAQKVCIVTV